MITVDHKSSIVRKALAGSLLAMPLCGGSAFGATKVGWALADQPNATNPYTPNPAYSYNSFESGSVGVFPGPTGFYDVQFALFGNKDSNFQISVVGGSGYCMAIFDSYPAGLACFDAQGNLASTEFALLYVTRTSDCCSADHAVAFLLGGSNGHGVGIADSYNSTGGTNSLIRKGTGLYTVTLPNLTKTGGQVLVTPYLTSLDKNNNWIPARCTALDWSAGSAGTTVDVACVDKTGAPVDNNFELAYTFGATLGAYGFSGGNVGAFTYANRPTYTRSYNAPGYYQYNGFHTGAPMIQRTGAGTYTVTVPGTLSYSSSTMLVSAVGPAGTYCNLAAAWTGATASVACYTQGGVPTDSKFNLTFQTTP